MDDAARELRDILLKRVALKLDRAIMGDAWYPLRPDHPWRKEIVIDVKF